MRLDVTDGGLRVRLSLPNDRIARLVIDYDRTEQNQMLVRAALASLLQNGGLVESSPDREAADGSVTRSAHEGSEEEEKP